MTLLELLRQELPKRGGWPEGAVECCRHRGTNSIDFYDETGNWPEDCYLKYGKDFAKEVVYENDYSLFQSVTREQYEATGWDGTGLPPVGCECERSWCGDKWLPCKILFISDETVVVKLATRESAYRWCEVSFRPLRTEAERAIDEMVRLSGVSIGAAKILYDAGYRK